MSWRRGPLKLTVLLTLVLFPFAGVYVLRYFGVFSHRYQTAHDHEYYGTRSGSRIQEELELLRKQRRQCRERLAALRAERKTLRLQTSREAWQRLREVDRKIATVDDAIGHINRELFRVEGPSPFLIALVVAFVLAVVASLSYYVAKKANWE